MTYLSQLHTNTLIFLAFATVMVAVYYALPAKLRLAWTLVCSLFFYAVCAKWAVLVFIASVAWTWFCGKRMAGDSASSKARRGVWLALGIVPAILILAFFKYNPALLEGFRWALERMGLGVSSQASRILFPLGISYYTFKNISYLVDVHGGRIQEAGSLLEYSTYAFLFTQITCGPIERFNHWQESIRTRGMTYDRPLFEHGFSMIVNGLFMKLVIANRLAGYVSEVFSRPDSFPALALWLAAFFYSIELYCDFAGYSNIAIGLTEMLGMDCCKNFARPYFSADIREFWSRWHISLSSWLRDYVYIPLGGSRCSPWRRNVNLMATFLVSGAWHGAGLNFIVWGAWHGLLNVLTPKKKTTQNQRGSSLKDALKILLNFTLVSFGWVLFGCASMKVACRFFAGMFTRFSFSMAALQQSILPFTHDNTCLAFFLTALLFIGILFVKELNAEKTFIRPRPALAAAWLVFALVCVELFGVFGSGFIYANF